MPRVPGRVGRLLLSFTVGIGLLGMPAVASADQAVRLTEHFVDFNCFFAENLVVGASANSRFGSFAFVESPALRGATESVTVVEEGGGATMDAEIPLFDGEGNPAGEAVLHAVLTPNGQNEVIDPSRFREGNRWINTLGGLIRAMDVSGSVELPTGPMDLVIGDCFGGIGDIQIFETNPHTFVLDNSGVFIDCHWQTSDGGEAGLFAINDSFGTFADAFLIAPRYEVFVDGPVQVALDATSLEATLEMANFLTQEPVTATASATLAALGDPVKSVILFQDGRVRHTEQRLIPDGTLAFTTGHQFTLDGEACFSTVFDDHVIETAPAGPKPGEPSAVNDTREGAVPLQVGKVVNDQTRNTAIAPEQAALEGCSFGHTLWYRFTGTGGPVTIDTAGSNFDTVIAVYDGDSTLACIDDVFFEPAGVTLQAALTIDHTVQGTTYFVQAGGFDPGIFTGVSEPEFGRLRIQISG